MAHFKAWPIPRMASLDLWEDVGRYNALRPILVWQICAEMRGYGVYSGRAARSRDS